MRIISGKYKGRRIFPPKNLPVRPTTDMSKEALFNVLNNHFSFDGLKVLDLFAGTGNISFEFAYRFHQNMILILLRQKVMFINSSKMPKHLTILFLPILLTD
jgi:16S rRNA G966 N2-methylase RsmD